MKKTLKNKLDKLFSIYIRLREADVNEFTKCVTCGKVDHWKKLQCGHFQSRRHLSTRWDEDNCHVQCYACNVARSGEQYKYGKYLDQKYYEGKSEELLNKANQLTKINDNEAKHLIEEIKEKIKQQEQRLNIKVKC